MDVLHEEANFTENVGEPGNARSSRTPMRREEAMP
jgi:hypothetical protein